MGPCSMEDHHPETPLLSLLTPQPQSGLWPQFLAASVRLWRAVTTLWSVFPTDSGPHKDSRSRSLPRLGLCTNSRPGTLAGNWQVFLEGRGLRLK